MKSEQFSTSIISHNNLNLLLLAELDPVQLACDPHKDEDGLPGQETLRGGASPGRAPLRRLETGDPVTFYKNTKYCQPFPCQGLTPDTCGYVIERKTREGSRDGSRDRVHSMAHRRHSLQVTDVSCQEEFLSLKKDFIILLIFSVFRSAPASTGALAQEAAVPGERAPGDTPGGPASKVRGRGARTVTRALALRSSPSES